MYGNVRLTFFLPSFLRVDNNYVTPAAQARIKGNKKDGYRQQNVRQRQKNN